MRTALRQTEQLAQYLQTAMRDPRIQNICDQIKLLDGKDLDELSRLKRQLPVITANFAQLETHFHTITLSHKKICRLVIDLNHDNLKICC